MSIRLTCPKGHRWEADDQSPTLAGALYCPTCGDAATPTSGTDDVRTIPPRSLTGAAPSSRTVVQPRPQVPGYEILAELGRGGMGVVYKAEQLALKRIVALKMILAQAALGTNTLARFRTEAEAVARLQHPNIVQIFEVGEQNGCPYFSLEFVDGGTLEKKLHGTPLPVREATQLAETLARAMHAAHERGIIHRDLKPGNILLTAGHSGAPASPATATADQRSAAHRGYTVRRRPRSHRARSSPDATDAAAYT